MIGLRTLFAVLAAGLGGMIVWALAADGRPLLEILSGLLAEPWAAVTFADLYLGFAISAAIIILTERRLWIGLFWALPVFILGNVWTVIWLILRLDVLHTRLKV